MKILGRPKINEVGNKHGKLTVIKEYGRTHGGVGEVLWFCMCDCGGSLATAGSALRSERTKQCKNCTSKGIIKRNSKHLHAHRIKKTSTYKSWANMYTRSTNLNRKQSKDYVSRGITMCDRWFDFENFLADMGERPDGMSIDRINNDLGYYKENCRWADSKTQNNNKRKKSKC